MTEQEKEETQPITVNGSTAARSPEEGTQPVKVSPDTPQTELPDWLLKFASSPEQAAVEAETGDISDFEIPYFNEMEEDQAFTPPVMPEENAWQELSDFHDQEMLDIEPIQETQETVAEVAAVDFQDPAADANIVEVTEIAIAVDPQVEVADKFKQELRGLLKQGQRADALAMIRENKADPVLAEAAKKTLRSQLTLSSDAGDLWEIYDELNGSSL